MEQHPVPQNVTTFQFRLIGDMTIKQFGYLAGGAILAYVSYKLPLPFFFTWPLTIISALTGFGLAFVPIEERPMDIWIVSFFKNVYSPTQYIWQKTKPAAPAPGAATAKPSFLTTMGKWLPFSSPTPPVPVDQSNRLPAETLPRRSVGELIQQLFQPPLASFTQKPKSSQLAAGGAAATQAPSPKPVIISAFSLGDLWAWFTKRRPHPVRPTDELPAVFGAIRPPSVTGKRLSFGSPPPLAKQETAPTRVVSPTPKPKTLESERSPSGDFGEKILSHARILELQQQLTEVLSQKDKLEKEVASLRQTWQKPAAGAQLRQATVATSPPPAPPTVHIIAPEGAVRAGLPRLTTFPNIVTGIIKDDKGNLLSSILVTVRDKDGLPLRALKTNRLGQFAASTPLPNGTYLVEVEDPRGTYTFDRVQVTVAGAVMPAIEIYAKSQRQISRDRLAREIFGNQIK